MGRRDFALLSRYETNIQRGESELKQQKKRGKKGKEKGFKLPCELPCLAFININVDRLELKISA